MLLAQQPATFFAPTIKNIYRKLVFACEFVFFLLFSTQNQVPQRIIGKCLVIYHITAFSVVVPTTSNNLKKFLSVEKTFPKFLIFGLISRE